MKIEARHAVSGHGSNPHRNASDVFGGVSGEVCADRNRRVFGMRVIDFKRINAAKECPPTMMTDKSIELTIVGQTNQSGADDVVCSMS
jgi:hypothetical protein